MAKQLIRNEDEAISSDEEHEIEPELADVPFGELQKLKSDGTAAFVSRIKSEKKTTGRANKNRPMEVSGMKPIARFREVFQVPKKTIRDPRFEPLCGKLDDDGSSQIPYKIGIVWLSVVELCAWSKLMKTSSGCPTYSCV